MVTVGYISRFVSSSFMQGFYFPGSCGRRLGENSLYHIVMDLERTLALELQHNTDVR